MADDTSWWNFWSDDTEQPDYGDSDYNNIGPVADGNIYGSYLDTGEYDADAWGTTLWGEGNYDEYGHFEAPKEESSSSSGLGKWASSPQGVSTILGVGATALKGYQAYQQQQYQRERAEEQERLQREDQKFRALMELAKLKYGPQPGGGGGGGSASRRNEMMIQALQQGSNEKVAALNNLARNYGSAITGNR